MGLLCILRRIFRFKRPGTPPWEECRGSFNFLGFTHYWGHSRRGKWVVKRKTEGSRFGRSLKSVAEWCKHHRHLPVREQQEALRRKLLGHYSYYGITGNVKSLGKFLYQVQRVWFKWLNRRSRGQSAPPALSSSISQGSALCLRSESMMLRNRMREIRSYGSVGAPGR